MMGRSILQRLRQISISTSLRGAFLMGALQLLPRAVERNVAFVPGAAFYADQPDDRTLRLSFVTASQGQIRTAIAALAAAIREAA